MIELSQDELRAMQHLCLYGGVDTQTNDICTPFEWYCRFIFKQNTGKDFIVAPYMKIVFDKMMDIFEGRSTRVMFNMPPRYFKTEIVLKMGISYGLALNAASKFILLSGGDDLALLTSEQTRNYVKSEPYQLIFPNVRVKKESDAKKRWDTEAGGGVYATAAGGQVIGFGAGGVEKEAKSVDDLINHKHLFEGFLVVDDPLKPKEALSDATREKINEDWDWSISTRINSERTPMIVNMHRVHPRDLCGYLLAQDDDNEWEVISFPAINADGTALFPHKHTITQLEARRRKNPSSFQSLFMQDPQPKEGLMYVHTFKTYEEIPTTVKHIAKNYTDTADEGGDFLCSINYIETEIGCYVTDIVYTRSAMETTEKLVGDILTRDKITEANIESNNGGRGFARNIERDIRMAGNYFTRINWFYQSGKKESRISTQRNEVQNMIYFPKAWEQRFPLFYGHIINHRLEGQKKLDDAADALTGIIENMSKKTGKILSFAMN